MPAQPSTSPAPTAAPVRARQQDAEKFVAGLFTDGELHLRISGNWIELSPEETDTLRQLLRGATA